MKETASRWQALTEEEKTPWILRAGEDKEKYAKAMEVFPGPMYVPGKKKKIPRKPEGKPKRAIPAFLYFSMIWRPKVRDKYPGMRVIFLSSCDMF